MTRHTRSVLLAAPLLVLALAMGACGGDSTGEEQAGGGNATGTSDHEKQLAFAKCMRANGVDMPDPSADGKVEVRVSGGKPGEDKMKAAEAKCRHLMPNGGKPPKAKPEDLAKMREVAKCMRRNGVPAFPDPDPKTGGIQIQGGRGGGGVDPQSSTFKKADKICNKGGGGRVDS